jgi:hypothetical protein
MFRLPPKHFITPRCLFVFRVRFPLKRFNASCFCLPLHGLGNFITSESNVETLHQVPISPAFSHGSRHRPWMEFLPRYFFAHDSIGLSLRLSIASHQLLCGIG